MSLTEKAYTQALQALKGHLDSYEPPPGNEPGWNGQLDSYSTGVLELLASRRITSTQARQVFGPDLEKAIAAHHSDPNLTPTARARLKALFSLP